MWPEHEARRGPNEVSICLFEYIREQASKGVKQIKQIEMFSDNCGGQNRNRFSAFALWYARKYFNMTRIANTFLEKGHAETENDSIHVTIESATRKIELYTPEQWFAAVRGPHTSKQKYRWKEMLAEDFFDFKTMSSCAKNLTTDDNREKIM